MPHSMSRDSVGTVRFDWERVRPSIVDMPSVRALYAIIVIVIALADSISCREELGA